MIEPFVIDQESSDVTQADGTANELQDWMSYRVPKGMKVVLRPEDVPCVYFEETDASAAQATALVKLEMRDATATERIALVQSTQYANFNGEFRDEDKLIHLDIQGEKVVGEQEYLVVQIKNPTPYADKDTGYFELRCHREI